MSDIEQKYCTKCGQLLPLHRFHKSAASPGGLRADCKRCRAIQHQERVASRYASVTQKRFNERFLGGKVAESTLRRWMGQGLLAVDRRGDELRIFADHPITKRFLQNRKRVA